MTGKIFLSYRRGDTGWLPHALFGRLEQAFPRENLFMDVAGGIKAGQDFVRVIEEQVSACDAMLVLIGPDWLTVADEAGRPRLENSGDFVHLEVESALRFGKRVIPVLVQETEMPRTDALPEPLKALVRRNAVGLTQEGFKADVQGLIASIQDALAEVEEARRRAATEAAPTASGPRSTTPTSRIRVETGSIRTFGGHTEWVFSVAFSPDGRTALSGSGDKTLKLWDVATGNEIITFKGRTGGGFGGVFT
jgi:hypothetical protein